jgi:hypothetical protein
VVQGVEREADVEKISRKIRRQESRMNVLLVRLQHLEVGVEVCIVRDLI